MKKMTPKAPDTQKILRILSESNRPVTTTTLKNKGRVAAGSVAKRIYDLRNEGYDIKTVTRKGVDGAKATTYSM